ncbi:helix-turn-helix domain-containing protein [Haladaptatus litoreus]|uniref:hypothetical protein n=1 Tax=Haladaptatus litoreus TaxID=553468 RepID=UPI0009FEAA0E|nr:hypothetical protein [Haladaptatus litoreus]
MTEAESSHERDVDDVINDSFDALANPARRRLLVELREHDSRSEWMAVEQDRRQPAMHHKHLPRLEDKGFIHWNKDAYEVKTGPQFGNIRPVLKFLDEHSDRSDDSQ